MIPIKVIRDDTDREGDVSHSSNLGGGGGMSSGECTCSMLDSAWEGLGTKLLKTQVLCNEVHGEERSYNVLSLHQQTHN